MAPKARPDMVDPLHTSKTTTPPIASFLESYLGNTIYVYRDAVLDFFDFLAGLIARLYCTCQQKHSNPANDKTEQIWVPLRQCELFSARTPLHQSERSGVHAVSLVSRRRTIVKYMAEVCTAPGT
jgi:hypothetical protein